MPVVFVYVGILSQRDRLFNVLLRESSRLVGYRYPSQPPLPVPSVHFFFDLIFGIATNGFTFTLFGFTFFIGSGA